MADVVLRSTQPALGAIKLAWWRERLEELDEGKVPAEPRLQDAANELLPRRLSGEDLAKLEAGWSALLEEEVDVARAEERGARLFELFARLLGAEADEAALDGGRLFAQMDMHRRGLLAALPRAGQPTPLRAGRQLRPLTGLAALSARDLRRATKGLEAEATPGRAWALIRHRLTGRL